MKYLVILLVFLVSCTTSIYRVFNKHEGVDPKAQQYVDEMVNNGKGKITKKMVKNISVAFVDKMFLAETAGVCWWTLNGNEIEIENRHWRTRSDIGKMSLIYHEMGHCLCNRLHAVEVYPGHWYSGIVNGLGKLLDSLGMIEHIGFFESTGCPASLMYPAVISDYCLVVHYKEYMDEFYSKCDL